MSDRQAQTRHHGRFLSLTHLAIYALALLVLAAPGYAAEVDKAKQTQVSWISVVVAVILVVVVGIGCFMNPKRTHQD